MHNSYFRVIQTFIFTNTAQLSGIVGQVCAYVNAVVAYLIYGTALL